MAVKDHALDGRIIEAATAEFLAHGFQKASLHKIAERAGITTGALYTRYQNKDDLFCSLVRGLMGEIAARMGHTAALYQAAHDSRSADAFLQAIRAEEKIYLDLLDTHYDACVLLFCKSGGSSLEAMMHRMMTEKARQTKAFFRSIARRPIDFDGIELILSQQFSYYQQLLTRGDSREKAVSCMETVDIFLAAGWKAIFDQIL